MELLRSGRIAYAIFCHSKREALMRATLPVSSIGGGASSGSTTFGRLAAKTSQLAGKGTTFLLATAVVVLWAITGPMFNYSDTWQLIINTGTTIVTFLMVFLIQNSQNRDSLALQVKLDELIVATKGARNSIACIEDASEEELEEAKKKLRARASKNR
jgi:low affinity Fe/Cu permease